MKTYPYFSLGQGIPPAPILEIKVLTPDWANFPGELSVEAFLDTGSDCTLIPLEIMSQLRLEISQPGIPIVGIGGGQVLGFACYINMVLGDHLFKASRVYGCEGERLSKRVLIGRDFLNQIRVEFDGIHQRFSL